MSEKFEDLYCQECRYTTGHSLYCNNQSDAELIARLRNTLSFTEKNSSLYRKMYDRIRTEVPRLQGKLAVLKHENNQLRKRAQQPKCKEKARMMQEKLKEIVEYADSFLANPPHNSCAKDFVASLRVIAAAGLPKSNQLPLSVNGGNFQDE